MLLARKLTVVLGFFSLLPGAGGLAGGAAGAGEPKKVESTIRFIAHVETVHVNINQDALAVWLKPVLKVVQERFAGDTSPRTVVIEVMLHAERPAEAIVAARPALDAANTQAILDAIDTDHSPRSRVVDANFRIVTKVNGGAPDKSRSVHCRRCRRWARATTRDSKRQACQKSSHSCRIGPAPTPFRCSGRLQSGGIGRNTRRPATSASCSGKSSEIVRSTCPPSPKRTPSTGGR